MPNIRTLVFATLLAFCCCHADSKVGDKDGAADAPGVSAPTKGASDTAGGVGAAAKDPASAASSADSSAPGLTLVPSMTILFVVVFFVGGVLWSVIALNTDTGWLVKALSEKSPSKAASGSNAQAGAAATPTGSTSRLIAFLGSIGMLAIYMGIGLYALWALFNGRYSEVKDAVKSVAQYLLFGCSMYAPYAVNQARAAFK